MNRQILSIIAGGLLGFFLAGVLPAQGISDAGGPAPAPNQAQEEVLATAFRWPLLVFTLQDVRVDRVQLVVRDAEGHLLSDSGEKPGAGAGWDTRLLPAEGNPSYELLAWDGDGRLVQRLSGEIQPVAAGDGALQASTFDVAGNYTVAGYLGVGTSTPERAVHIRGSNAVFRMDRSKDTAAFMIVRTDDSSNILKTFVVGVNASGPNQGSFVINDLGQAVTGGGTARLTIANDGTATFGGTVKSTGFVTTSSRALKTGIRPLENALGKVLRLQGVSFAWKDTGEPAVGMIAEDVTEVAPEVVAEGPDGQPAGIDYGRVAALLVESFKAQQAEIERIGRDCDRLEAQLAREDQTPKKRKKSAP